MDLSYIVREVTNVRVEKPMVSKWASMNPNFQGRPFTPSTRQETDLEGVEPVVREDTTSSGRRAVGLKPSF